MDNPPPELSMFRVFLSSNVPSLSNLYGVSHGGDRDALLWVVLLQSLFVAMPQIEIFLSKMSSSRET